MPKDKNDSFPLRDVLLVQVLPMPQIASPPCVKSSHTSYEYILPSIFNSLVPLLSLPAPCPKDIPTQRSDQKNILSGLEQVPQSPKETMAQNASCKWHTPNCSLITLQSQVAWASSPPFVAYQKSRPLQGSTQQQTA